MPVEQPRTVVIHAHGMVAAKSSNVIVQMLSKKLDFSKVRSIQFVPGGRIRVTFSCLEYRNIILNRKTLLIDDLHHLNITESDDPVTNVYVHYLPVEAGDIGLRLALSPFGKIVGITHQNFSGFKDIQTGTRIVRMSLHQHIPFQCNIQGYPCRVWYVGQPLKCTICGGAHKAADCPDRNKCRRCHQGGHFAKDCKNAWGTTPQARQVTGPPHPSGDPPPPPPPAPVGPPVSNSGPVSPNSPTPPVVADPEAVVSEGPVPLMSLDVQPPLLNSDVEFTEVVEDSSQVTVSSQISLFSESEDSIREFSEEESASSPASSSSPAISSFTSPLGDCSESILQNVQIVSSDPKVVEQILNDVRSSPIGTDNSSDGPIVANNSREGPKVASSGNSLNVTCNSSDGPKVANNNSNVNSSSNGPKVAKNKNPKVSSHQSISKVGPKVVNSARSNSDSEFKKPRAVAGGASESPARSFRSRSPLPSAGSHQSLPLTVSSRPSRPR